MYGIFHIICQIFHIKPYLPNIHILRKFDIIDPNKYVFNTIINMSFHIWSILYHMSNISYKTIPTIIHILRKFDRIDHSQYVFNTIINMSFHIWNSFYHMSNI